MKRLRDREDPSSPVEMEAIALMRSVERYAPPLGMKQRVRARLLATRAATGTRLFRPALAVGVVLLAAGASAAIGGSVAWRNAVTRVGSGDVRPRETMEAFGHGPSSNRGAVESASEVAPDFAPTAAAIPAPAASTSALDARGSSKQSVSDSALGTVRAEARRGSAKSSLPPAADASKPLEAAMVPEAPKSEESSKPSEEVKLVFDSMRALRRDGHPERAAQMLDEYLRRYPRGALAEEALALSIEAATMRGDPRARELANRYLARYPNGQFLKAAERARARFSP